MKHCSICGIAFNERGNNPWPLAELNDDGTGQCCNGCNRQLVVPARIYDGRDSDNDHHSKEFVRKYGQQLGDVSPFLVWAASVVLDYAAPHIEQMVNNGQVHVCIAAAAVCPGWMDEVRRLASVPA